MAGSGRVVVVGASAAGLTTAETLRREGHRGPITLVGDEPHLPYDRPPLSKQVLIGTWEPGRTTLRAATTYHDLGIGVRLATRATGVDLDRRTVALASGDHVPYDHLVVATGVRPRHLRQGHDLRGVHVLRTLDDALALRSGLAGATSVAVVGAGFLGCEAAAVIRTLGMDVTLVDVEPLPLGRQFGDELGARIGDLHREHGVVLRTGTGVVGLTGDDRVTGVALTDGTTVAADLVLVAIGSAPATDWLATSGIPLRDGVLCDATCQAAPGVHAAGDVARWHHDHHGVAIRVEHRMNATEQGMAVARNILGDPRPFTPVPYFWTDQFDARIQAYGIFPPEAKMTLARGAPGARGFLAHYHHDGDLVGVLGWNMPREVRAARALLAGD